MNLDFCVDAMRGALLLSRQALQVELAVGIVVYNAYGSVSLAAKKELRAIYAAAGQADCLTPDSRSYQTVNRRMDRCGKLFDHIGPNKISKVLSKLDDGAIIDTLVAFLAKFGIDSMDNVLDIIGEPRRREPHDPSIVNISLPPVEGEQPLRRQSDRPGAIHIETEHIKLDAAPELTEAEVMGLIRQLLDLVKPAA
jgi:hypothetical protein